MQAKSYITQGEEITIAGQQFILPPLPLIRLKSIAPIMKGGNPMEDEAYANALVDAIYYSLIRNYDDLPRELVADNLDMLTFQSWVTAFQIANGFQKKEQQPGEATANQ